jgi:alkylation response protein AidB-like acyl-CoA dehydrogenase
VNVFAKLLKQRHGIVLLRRREMRARFLERINVVQRDDRDRRVELAADLQQRASLHMAGGLGRRIDRHHVIAGDPRTILRFGRRATKRRAAETLLAAKAFASEVAVEIASDLLALSGASAADERHDLSRHWRNARTHASHDPADWKYHHAGNFLLNGALPPNHAQL